ncbi:YbaK/EbsC family protein [Streptomyces sp. URMC 126]|uniref:YbaK/EbsC family protein n=1 Tax=Streptomyces sp. URMC 126 TaxID=3423401 RepID=UPI003F1BD913
MDAFDDVRPASERMDLLVPPVAAALRARPFADPAGAAAVEPVLHVDTAPEIADTAVLVENHGPWLLEQSANCVVVAAKRGGVTSLAACVALGHTRVDVNGTVRRHLGARKVSFAPMDTALEATGMEYGGITPIGLPADWPLLIDAAVVETPYVLIGSGSRRGKLIAPGRALAELPGVTVLEGLAVPA